MNIFDSLFGRRRRLRFTGEGPPPHLWGEFPNWRLALEEEGKAGQDETTLMPHEEQSFVGEHTSFTAGSVQFNDGHVFPAFLEVGDKKLDGCQVYELAKPWRVYFDYPAKKWRAFSEDWLPEAQRSPVVSMDDERIFPMTIRMLVPWKKGGQPSVYEITSEGVLHMKNA